MYTCYDFDTCKHRQLLLLFLFVSWLPLNSHFVEPVISQVPPCALTFLTRQGEVVFFFSSFLGVGRVGVVVVRRSLIARLLYLLAPIYSLYSLKDHSGIIMCGCHVTFLGENVSLLKIIKHFKQLVWTLFLLKNFHCWISSLHHIVQRERERERERDPQE